MRPPATWWRGWLLRREVRVPQQRFGRVKQRAQYIEDSWQISDAGWSRSVCATTSSPTTTRSGAPYLRLTQPQWAPRLGFSWDVNGDSSFKIYGNAGRYYLAMPTSVALRSAGLAVHPHVLHLHRHRLERRTAWSDADQHQPWSGRPDLGQWRIRSAARPEDLRRQPEDRIPGRIHLGFDKKLSDAWVYGAKATYSRSVRNAIDDVGDTCRSIAKMNAMGIDPNSYDATLVPASILINPGNTSYFNLPKLAGGYYTVQMDWKKDFHFNTP